ncbi:MAG: type II toxin-antitoxin system HicA family toxin [Methanosarcinaceae archaeon]
MIPNYTEIPIGTLRSILRQANLTQEDFVKLL